MAKEENRKKERDRKREMIKAQIERRSKKKKKCCVGVHTRKEKKTGVRSKFVLFYNNNKPANAKKKVGATELELFVSKL